MLAHQLHKTNTPGKLIGGMGTPKKGIIARQKVESKETYVKEVVAEEKKCDAKVARKGKENMKLKPAIPTPTLHPPISSGTNHSPSTIPVPTTLLPTSPCPPLTNQSFSVIDVCSDRRLFNTFLEEWKRQMNFSISVACEKINRPSTAAQGNAGIGAKFHKGKNTIL